MISIMQETTNLQTTDQSEYFIMIVIICIGIIVACRNISKNPKPSAKFTAIGCIIILVCILSNVLDRIQF